MPVSTDSLNEDVKELKADIRDLRSDMEVMKGDIHRIDVSVAEMRSDLRNAIGVGKWAVTLLTTAMFSFGFGSVVAGVWWASSITTEVKHLSESSNKMVKVVEAIHREPSPQPGPGDIVIPDVRPK